VKDSELYRMRAEEGERISSEMRYGRDEMLEIARQWRVLEQQARLRDSDNYAHR
jgi:hypothetical protein